MLCCDFCFSLTRITTIIVMKKEFVVMLFRSKSHLQVLFIELSRSHGVQVHKRAFIIKILSQKTIKKNEEKHSISLK